MKKIMQTTATLLFAGIISLLLNSFATKPGGEGFEVYLNQKVIMQQFGKNIGAANTISLEQASPNDQLMVKYHRCGNGGSNRVFSLRDAKNNILREWKFTDEKNTVAIMTCQVKDIIGKQKDASSRKLNLYYASSEVPQGRLLTTLVTNAGSNATASRR